MNRRRREWEGDEKSTYTVELEGLLVFGKLRANLAARLGGSSRSVKKLGQVDFDELGTGHCDV